MELLYFTNAVGQNVKLEVGVMVGSINLIASQKYNIIVNSTKT